MTTHNEAVDSMLDMFKAAFDPSGWPVDYPNTAAADSVQLRPAAQTGWARVTVLHFGSRQVSISDGTGASRYNRWGMLTVQLFTRPGVGLTDIYDKVKLITDAFEGKHSAQCVWFRNARPQEIGERENWYQVNVNIDFNYDEVK